MKIDKGIPIGGETRGRRPVYPFAQMGVGDSILVDGGPVGRSAVASAYAYAASSVATERRGEEWVIVGRKQFTSRKEGTGVRIWRAKDRAFEPDEYAVIDGVRWIK